MTPLRELQTLLNLRQSVGKPSNPLFFLLLLFPFYYHPQWHRIRHYGPICLRFLTDGLAFERQTEGRRPDGFLGLSANDRTILFLVILQSQSDKTVFALRRSPRRRHLPSSPPPFEAMSDAV